MICFLEKGFEGALASLLLYSLNYEVPMEKSLYLFQVQIT